MPVAMNDPSPQPRGAEAIDPSRIDPSQMDARVARNLGAVGDEQLAAAMAGPMREQILTEIFGRMATHLRADKARDTDAVIHWRIGGRPRRSRRVRDGHPRWRLHGEPGPGVGLARVVFTIAGTDFLRLVTGNAAGPTLFMRGKLKIEGDMMFAASAPPCSRFPADSG